MKNIATELQGELAKTVTSVDTLLPQLEANLTLDSYAQIAKQWQGLVKAQNEIMTISPH